MNRFYSTQNKNHQVTLEHAVMQGLAEDGGLFMPCMVPLMPDTFFKNLQSLSFPDICFEITKHFFQSAIPTEALKSIVDKAINFDAPMRSICTNISSLELFHGPTLSFKDFGARFMAQLMEYFVQYRHKTLNILVATSGDTGSAIAQAFLNVSGIRVWILYPKDKVSWIQEKQLTTMGHNITACEVDGTFDDCQRLVKLAFSDLQLRQKLSLTSANSINIARLIPQSFYYFYAYAQSKEPHLPLVFSVPCGNFGNLTAGLLAKRMGLPVSRFVAATNVNDSVPKYLQTGIFKSHPSKSTLSNAMDVGNPSNFARMIDLYQNQWRIMGQDIFGASFTDSQTEQAMEDVYTKYGYLLDPHGAVAYLGLQAFLKIHPEKTNGIFLETAHPAKFANDVERIVKHKIPIPDRLEQVLSKPKESTLISTRYEDLRVLLEGY